MIGNKDMLTSPIWEYVLRIIEDLLFQNRLTNRVKVKCVETGLCGLPMVHEINEGWEMEIGMIYINRLYALTSFYSCLCNYLDDISDIFTAAIKSVVMHEIGHIKNNHKNPYEREQEDLANGYEFDTTISDTNKYAIFGTLISMFLELELDISLGRNPCKEYGEHPSTLAKIDNFLSRCPQYAFKDEFNTIMQLVIKVRPVIGYLIVQHNLHNILTYLKNEQEMEFIAQDLSKLDDE